MVEDIQAGNLDAAFILAPFAMVLAREGSRPVKIVHLGHRDGTCVIVPKDSPYQSFADLRGARIAIPHRYSNQRILIESRRLDDFKRNPQQFIEQTAEAINRCKRLALVDGIKYHRIGDGEYYAQELFQENELRGYIGNMLMNTEKAVYEHVVYDSDVERDFATELERNEAHHLAVPRDQCKLVGDRFEHALVLGRRALEGRARRNVHVRRAVLDEEKEGVEWAQAFHARSVPSRC